MEEVKQITSEEAQVILDWVKEGERIHNNLRWTFLFRLGYWWADRPWRNRCYSQN